MVMVNEVSKSQSVRLLDVFLYGPAMIYWSWKKKLTPSDKVLLTALGIGTIIYNARNYSATKIIMRERSEFGLTQ